MEKVSILSVRVKYLVYFYQTVCNNLKFLKFKFFERYSKGYIFPIKSLKKTGMPIEPKLLQEFLEKSCEKFRHKLVKEYVFNGIHLNSKYLEFILGKTISY